MSGQYDYCFVSERTDVGCKRSANEDNMTHFECRNGLVATVCDGMGGHVGGAVASQIAVDTIRQFLTENYFESPYEAIGMAIETANKAILNRARQQPELTGMGSTCVMLIVRNGEVYIGSVGDSRVYLIRNRKIVQLTKDQSFVQMLVDRGELTKEQAEHHPRKNEITNCLGIQDMQPATVLHEAFVPEAGDCFLLCSDGLSGMVSDDRIERIVSRQSELTSQQRVDLLVETARQNGGIDNITVQIVEFSVSPTAAAKKAIPWKWIAIAAAALAVIAAVTGIIIHKSHPADDSADSTATAVAEKKPIIKHIRFNDVVFDKTTLLSFVLDKDDSSYYASLTYPRNKEVSKEIGRIDANLLFKQLEEQFSGNNKPVFKYVQGIYSISSFEDCQDSVVIPLGDDSLQYRICLKEKSKTIDEAKTNKGGGNGDGRSSGTGGVNKSQSPKPKQPLPNVNVKAVQVESSTDSERAEPTDDNPPAQGGQSVGGENQKKEDQSQTESTEEKGETVNPSQNESPENNVTEEKEKEVTDNGNEKNTN